VRAPPQARVAAACGSNECPRSDQQRREAKMLEAKMLMAIYALYGVAVLLALVPIAVVLVSSPRARMSSMAHAWSSRWCFVSSESYVCSEKQNRP
jgi:hypothetical protein